VAPDIQLIISILTAGAIFFSFFKDYWTQRREQNKADYTDLSSENERLRRERDEARAERDLLESGIVERAVQRSIERVADHTVEVAVNRILDQVIAKKNDAKI
jgi:phosphate uptake regulator